MPFIVWGLVGLAGLFGFSWLTDEITKLIKWSLIAFVVYYFFLGGAK